MKKLIAVGMAFTIMATIHAQSTQVKIKVKEAEIPVSVVESFKKDFKGGTAEEWDIVPAAIVGEEYVVTGYDKLDGEKPTSYAVMIKGTNMKAEALYDQNGKEAKDRKRSEHDYKVNLKAELEIRLLHEKIDHLMIFQTQRIMESQQIQLDYLEELSAEKERYNR